MRLLVISDSHGYTGKLGNILMAAEAGGPMDAILHLGDGYSDLSEFAGELPPIYQVAGNCDFFRSDTLAIHDFSGARILLTHGHHQNVKLERDSLFSLALRQNARAALYGHTHRQKMEWRSGILLLNPGAAMDGRYAILTVNRLGAVDARLYGD